MKGIIIKYKCDYCGAEISVGSWLMKNMKKHFCDKKCHDIYLKEMGPRGNNHPNYKKQKIKCSNCGDDLYRTPYDISQHDNFYCNRRCMGEHRKKFLSGENHPSWKGGCVTVVCATCNKNFEIKRHALNENNFCCQKCLGQWLSKNHSGENSWLWQGGKNDLQNTIRKSTKMKEWVRSIFERDDFTCKKCNDGSNNLNAHHLKSLAQILRDNNISTIEEALVCDELWDLKNGETVCYDCHCSFHVIYGKRKFLPHHYYEWIKMEAV
ncbi:MAG: hypothetical protein ACW98X_27510 [Promethearchaeota archaeon]|jgi:endogenous inhibitor of DNA gyrase (YacG/DUF329 family)